MSERRKKYFIDTNIIMYSAGKEHKFKEACLKILRDMGNYENEYYLNTEVFQEILYRYSSIGMRIFGIELAARILELFDNILAIDAEDIYMSISLMEKYERLLSRDAIIIANMVNKGIEEIISVDNDFDEIEEIKRTDPMSFIT
jgi:uncharacterized protein